jgi:hypothetical protein
MDHVQAVVYVEGPREVTNASITASTRLIAFIDVVREASVAIRQGGPLEEHQESVELAMESAHRNYLEFLSASSEALGSELLP